MEKKIPFFFTQKITLAGNANGTMVFQGGQGEKVFIAKIAQASTIDNTQSPSFAFSLKNSNGQNYNATSTGGTAPDAGYNNNIDSRIIGDGNHPTLLPEELFLEGNQSLNIALTETSGSSNTITLMFLGYKVLQGI